MNGEKQLKEFIRSIALPSNFQRLPSGHVTWSAFKLSSQFRIKIFEAGKL